MNLLEMTLQGGVLILVILLLRGLLRYRLPGWTFRILWGVALVRLLVPLALPSQWSVYTDLDRLADRAETVQTAPAPQPGPSVIWTAPSEEPSHSDVPAAPSEPVPAPVPEGAAQTVPVKVPWHIVLWGTGAGLLALAFAVSYGRNMAVFRTALPLDAPALDRWRGQLPELRRVPIRRCDRVRSPLTYGLVRPVILLPKGVDCDDTQELGYILLHEGAHIRHRDAWWKLLFAAALCVHWFNPLVWCMYVCAGRDLERCCDEAVVRACGLEARSAYALTLLKWEERRSGLLPLCSPFSNKIMKERVISIMKLKKQSAAAIALALVLVTGTTVAFATSPAPEMAGKASVSQETQNQTPDTASPDAAKPNTIIAAAGVKPELDSPKTAVNAPAPIQIDEATETVSEAEKPQESGETQVPEVQKSEAQFSAQEEYFTSRWNIPEGELPQWYEFPIANLEEGEALAAYLQQTKGLKEGDVQYNTRFSDGQMTLEISYAQTRKEAQFLVDCPNGEYPKNSKGETYGSRVYREYVGHLPDLIAAVATDTGASGYVESNFMNGYLGYPYVINGVPDDIDKYMEWRKNQPAELKFPVYDAEHEQILGYFYQTNEDSYEYVHTPEEIEEEVQMVTDMMTKNGFSQQEIDEYIQQLRERYAQ